MTAVLEKIGTTTFPTLMRRKSIDTQSTETKKALENVDITRPIFHGRVFKQTKAENSFNKRYFVLYPGLLLYYKHERDYLQDLRTEMFRFTLLKLDGLHLTLVENPPPGVKYCFKLHLEHPENHRNDILLAFNNRHRRRDWMKHLQQQNPYLLHPKKK